MADGEQPGPAIGFRELCSCLRGEERGEEKKKKKGLTRLRFKPWMEAVRFEGFW